MNTEIAQQSIKQPVFSLVPQNLTEAMKLAEMMASSELVPKNFRGKAGDVLIAVQMGAEVGLAPMAAIQNIAVINGKPGIYGDGGKAILLAAGCWIEEDDIKTIKAAGQARCKITRGKRPPVERTYSIENAKTAKLWGKEGPWTTNPERQMAWRAFWFAARDIASDLLKGLGGAEELADYVVERDITPQSSLKSETPAGLPQYTDEQLAIDIPAMQASINAGKNSPQRILAMVGTKYQLSGAQADKIRALVAQPEPEPEPEIDPFVAAMDAAGEPV